tara:strand:- start:914 stop:1663 length:750 start_codon:yes stop_codon:yes gene_type:complete
MTNNIYLIANWKMYGSIKSVNSINKVIQLSKKPLLKNINIVYCPPFTLSHIFAKKLKNSKINVGAQDCYIHHDTGPFTGNISAKQLKNIGLKYVILGHSEKRNDGDTNKIINKKIFAAIKNKLKVILCIGEKYQENIKKLTIKILKKQINDCLKNIPKKNIIFIAYEPVWSIGTGLIPKNEDLEKIIKKIRTIVLKEKKFINSKFLYGGSVNEKNIKNLTKIRGLDGFLIGGASQNSNKFIDIVKKTII